VVLVVPAVDSRVGHDEVLHREQPGAVGETDLAWLSLRFARPDSLTIAAPKWISVSIACSMIDRSGALTTHTF